MLSPGPLAQDVGSLKRVLSNVKIRGTVGEVQLGMLLEQVLAPEQYEANVHTRPGSDRVVEYAIKLPGKEEGGAPVYLPIDAKFPKDVYEQLLDAYDAADAARVEAASRVLEQTVRAMARDIRDKYIAPPHTTDFGIMFLQIPFQFFKFNRTVLNQQKLLVRIYLHPRHPPLSLAARM